MAKASGGQIKKKKGDAGAAKNYINRTQAIKKLQCSISDFRRLCILKGIFPRQPKNHKKANKGSTAPSSFYYVKDIQYLLHEPLLGKLREHKSFAKKLSKAVGRENWHKAKSLEENSKPTYRLDHIIKERYPSFPDALRDLDDALSLIILFAHLPASEKIPAAVIANCSKLAAEWQLYVMRTHSLKKVFLSIKGIYFQAQVKGETITWLVPYMFTQNIPSDIDFRIMMTFLELYQTLLGFTFYKLYSDINLVYPPTFDAEKDNAAAGIGALLLEETSRTLTLGGKKGTEEGLAAAEAGKKVTAKEVKKQIRHLAHAAPATSTSAAAAESGQATVTVEDGEGEGDTSMALEVAAAGDATDFPAPLDGGDAQPAREEDVSDLFAPYHFFLSREVTRPTLEFIVRSFGGRVGWDPILGAGSPYDVSDPRITHHIVDRPVPVAGSASAGADSNAVVLASHPGKRAYIQPQWVVDCVNQRKLLPTEQYAPGATLPPHLSPFVDAQKVREQGGYVPAEAGGELVVSEGSEDEEVDEDDDEAVADEEEFTGFGGAAEEDVEDTDMQEEAEGDDNGPARPALLAAAQNPQDTTLLHAAELEAESLSVPYSTFSTELAALSKSLAAPKKGKKSAAEAISTQEANPASILLSNKTRKLYNKMKYGEGRRNAEAEALAEKKKKLVRQSGKKQAK